MTHDLELEAELVPLEIERSYVKGSLLRATARANPDERLEELVPDEELGIRPLWMLYASAKAHRAQKCKEGRLHF